METLYNLSMVVEGCGVDVLAGEN